MDQGHHTKPADPLLDPSEVDISKGCINGEHEQPVEEYGSQEGQRDSEEFGIGTGIDNITIKKAADGANAGPILETGFESGMMDEQ